MQRLRVIRDLPAIEAFSVADLSRATADARLAVARSGQDVGRPVETAAVPFLFGSGPGKRFVASPPPRALALGAPAAQCPGVGVAAGGADAPARALSACLQDGAAALDVGADFACGCALVALDDLILAPERALDYAASVSGRLLGVGDGGPLAVVETPDAEGDAQITFRSPAGPLAQGTLSPDGTATLTLLADGRVFTGERARRGWRRGRVKERLLLQDADGARLIALIAFEPADIVREGAALADWPADLR